MFVTIYSSTKLHFSNCLAARSSEYIFLKKSLVSLLAHSIGKLENLVRDLVTFFIHAYIVQFPLEIFLGLGLHSTSSIFRYQLYCTFLSLFYMKSLIYFSNGIYELQDSKYCFSSTAVKLTERNIVSWRKWS